MPEADLFKGFGAARLLGMINLWELSSQVVAPARS